MQSSTKRPLTMQLVASARETLEAIPAAPEELQEVSVTGAIHLLMPTIQKLFKKGYKRGKVVELLREQGIDCSEATLKTLYRAPKARREKPSKGDDAPPAGGIADRAATAARAVPPPPAGTARATANVPPGDRRPPAAVGAPTASGTKAS